MGPLAEFHSLQILLLEQRFEDPFIVGDQILKSLLVFSEVKKDLCKVFNQNIEVFRLLLLLYFPVNLHHLIRGKLKGLGQGPPRRRTDGLFNVLVDQDLLFHPFFPGGRIFQPF